MTVSSAAVLGQNTKVEPAESDYFNARKAEYLRHGATHSGAESYAYGTPVGTPDDLPFELSRMPTHGGSPNASTEHLIQYPPTYSSPHSRDPRVPAGASHAHQTSAHSFASAQSVQDFYGVQQQPDFAPVAPMETMRSAYPPGAGSPQRAPFIPGVGGTGSPQQVPFQPHHQQGQFSYSRGSQPRTRTPSPGPDLAYGSPCRMSQGSQMSLDFAGIGAGIRRPDAGIRSAGTASPEIRGSPEYRGSPRTSGQWDRFGPVPSGPPAVADDREARLPPGARRH